MPYVMIGVRTYVCSLLEILLNQIWTVYQLYGVDFNLGPNFEIFSHLYLP